MELSLEKWLAMALLTVLSIILGLIPYFIIRYTNSSLSQNSTRYQLLLTTLSCFGAGVMLSTALIHVLPEVREAAGNVHELQTTFEDHFPVAEMLVLAGFCMIYFMEEVAHFIMLDSHRGHHHHPNTIARHNSIAHGIPMPHASGTRTSVVITTSSRESDIGKPNLADASSPASVIPQENGGLEEFPNDKLFLNSPIRSTLALIALSFHSICEGLAIGIENSVNVWVVFGGIASHKLVIAFCMGMELMSTKANPWIYIGSIVFFSVMSPLGIFIGCFIGSPPDSPTLGVVIIEGLVCGTLLYVVFFEILNREKERKSYSMPDSRAVGFVQFIALVVGLVTMGWLSNIAHSHQSENPQREDSHLGEHLF